MQGGPEHLVREGFAVLVAVGGPVLGALLVAGLVVAVVQAATQINDPAVGLFPRLAAGLLIVFVLGGWMVERLARYLLFACERIAEGR
jgi:flagellar biosynthesis protein FliQ